MGETALARVTHDGEILPPRDEGLTMVTTPDVASQRLRELQSFVTSVMIDGVDFGVIPGCGDKKVLLQPGAQKLAEIYGLTASYTIEEKTLDFAQGFVMYTIRCRLSRGDRPVAECVGSCNSRERKYRNSQCYDVANTVLKMAEKRAYVGAVISSTRSSGIFTQDLEDAADVQPRAKRDWFAELSAALANATTESMRGVKAKIAWARDKQHITTEQYAQLVAAGKARVEQLAQEQTSNESNEPSNDNEPPEPGSEG